MTDKKIEYGLIQTFCPHPENIDCSDKKCNRCIGFMQKCFIDHKTGELYCKDCGIMVRYERKKQSQRAALGMPEIKINGE